jgi:hypothetical protein
MVVEEVEGAVVAPPRPRVAGERCQRGWRPSGRKNHRGHWGGRIAEEEGIGGAGVVHSPYHATGRGTLSTYLNSCAHTGNDK